MRSLINYISILLGSIFFGTCTTFLVTNILTFLFSIPSIMILFNWYTIFGTLLATDYGKSLLIFWAYPWSRVVAFYYRKTFLYEWYMVFSDMKTQFFFFSYRDHLFMLAVLFGSAASVFLCTKSLIDLQTVVGYESSLIQPKAHNDILIGDMSHLKISKNPEVCSPNLDSSEVSLDLDKNKDTSVRVKKKGILNSKTAGPLLINLVAFLGLAFVGGGTVYVLFLKST